MRYIIRTSWSRGTDYLIYDQSNALLYKLKRRGWLAHSYTDAHDTEIISMKKIGRWRLTYEFYQGQQLVATLTEYGLFAPFFATFHLTAAGQSIFTVKHSLRDGYKFRKGRQRIGEFRSSFFGFGATLGHLNIYAPEHEHLIVSAFGVLRAVDSDRADILADIRGAS